MIMAPWAAAALLAATGIAPLAFRVPGGDWATPAASVDLAPERRRAIEAAVDRALEKNDQGCFFYALVDLNGDGADELLVQARGPEACGSQGCPLLFFRWKEQRLVQISRTGLVRNVGVTPWKGKGPRPLIVATWGGEYRELRAKGGRYPKDAYARSVRVVKEISPDVKQVPWIAAASCSEDEAR